MRHFIGWTEGILANDGSGQVPETGGACVGDCV